MSAARDDGGPAFPVNELNQVTGDICAQHFGMTLRDYLAAKAMPIAMDWVRHNYSHDLGAFTWGKGDFEIVADRAYELADEMLKARSR